MSNAKVFWSNVFRVLKHQGRSVEYLAKRLGVSHTALYRWRDGSRVSPLHYHETAADVLGVPKALLFLPDDLPSSKNNSSESSVGQEEHEREAVSA